jgi:hypothetical protein
MVSGVSVGVIFELLALLLLINHSIPTKPRNPRCTIEVAVELLTADLDSTSLAWRGEGAGEGSRPAGLRFAARLTLVQSSGATSANSGKDLTGHSTDPPLNLRFGGPHMGANVGK